MFTTGTVIAFLLGLGAAVLAVLSLKKRAHHKTNEIESTFKPDPKSVQKDINDAVKTVADEHAASVAITRHHIKIANELTALQQKEQAQKSDLDKAIAETDKLYSELFNRDKVK